MADGDKTIEVVVDGYTSTDAVQGVLMSYTPPDETVVQIEVIVVAQQSNGTKSFMESFVALVRRDGGTISVTDQANRETGAAITIGSPTWSVTSDDNVNTIFEVLVTGAGGENVTWTGILQIITLEEMV